MRTIKSNKSIQRARLLSGALFLGAVLIFGALVACGESADTATASEGQVRSMEARGKYLVVIGGCNDCHTIGYPESNGKIPESEWLTGAPVGFRGPWGTTYPVNLRLSVAGMDEENWVTMTRTREALPPMPWPSLNQMDEQDLRAIYRYIKSLGPKGVKAPLAVGPDQEPETPYILFEPLHMERLQAGSN